MAELKRMNLNELGFGPTIPVRGKSLIYLHLGSDKFEFHQNSGESNLNFAKTWLYRLSQLVTLFAGDG